MFGYARVSCPWTRVASPGPLCPVQALALALERRLTDASAPFPAVSRPAPSSPVTLVLAPEECLLHYTAPEPIARTGPPPPPENVERLKVLTREGVEQAF